MLADFVLETANAPGTNGVVNLAGAAAGRQSFAQAFATGTNVYYFMDDGTQAEWGVGLFTAGAPNTLTRSTVVGNTADNTARLNFAGAVRVYNEVPAERLPYLDASQNVTLPASLTVTGGIACAGAGVSTGGMRFYSTPTGYGAFWYNDNSNAYLLLTNTGNALAGENALRPFYVGLATGAVTIDGTGAGTTFGGSVAVVGSETITGGLTVHGTTTLTGNGSVSGALTVDGNVVFGTGGTFYANPNSGGNQLLNFAPNQYIEFVPGTGFTWGSTGTISINTGGLTVNGSGICYNNGSTYGINISGTAASAVQSVGTGFTVNGQCNVTAGIDITGNIAGSGASGGYVLTGGGVTTSWAGGVAMLATGGYLYAFGFGTGSDRRLKDDIRDITDAEALAWVQNGRSRIYTMDGKRRAGFIAQEDIDSGRGDAVVLIPSKDPRTAEADPGYCEAGFRLSREYQEDNAYLTKALQIALDRIERLTDRIAALESRHG